MLFMIYGVEPIWVFYMIMYTLHLLTYYGFLYACITLLKVALSIEIPWPTMVLLQIVKEHTYIVSIDNKHYDFFKFYNFKSQDVPSEIIQ